MMFRSSKRKDQEGVRLYRKRFWLSRWFLYFVCTCFVLAAIGAGGMLLYLKQFKEQADEFDLSEMLELETASVIYDKKGNEIGRIFVENRRPVKFEEVPFHLIEALVATEDSRYFVHKGVDYLGIARAMIANFREGSVVQGASTITQQLARQSFGLTGRNYNRKLVEAFLASRIEQHYSKVEIMELYLNKIYFGGGNYGVNSAAQGYFGKPAKELSIAESAVLVGLIKSPNKLSPLRHPDLATESRNLVFGRMLNEKMITQEEWQSLRSEPLVVHPSYPDTGSSYVYEYIRQQVIKAIGFEKASVGGFQIYTTIDKRIQDSARHSLAANLSRIERQPGFEHQTYQQYEDLVSALPEEKQEDPPAPDYLQGAMIMIDNQTGGIITLVGGRDYGHSEFNRAVQARRSTGTAFTPLVYAAAFAGGKFPGSPANDIPIDNRRVMLGGTEGILGEWGHESNYNFHEGEITARRALVQSKIAATVRIGEEAGVERVLNLAKTAGIDSPMREFNATFIGASEVLLSEMALAYTIFPNKGTRPENLYIIQTIKDNDGAPVFTADRAKHGNFPVIDPVSAYQVHSCLEQVLETGTARKALPSYGLSEQFIGGGKTGTAYDFTDNTFLGYTDKITCGVWVGLDRPRTIYRGAFSNETVLPIWVDVMNSALSEYPPSPIEPPEGVTQIEICDRSGKLATDACYEPETVDGQSIFSRCTHVEYVRESRLLNAVCPVHGGERSPGAISNPALAFSPKVSKALTISGVQPVALRSPTVLGNDPYNSVLPKFIPTAPGGPGGTTDAETGKPVVKAAAVVRPAQVLETDELGEEKFRVSLPRPGAIEFD